MGSFFGSLPASEGVPEFNKLTKKNLHCQLIYIKKTQPNTIKREEGGVVAVVVVIPDFNNSGNHTLEPVLPSFVEERSS